METYINKDKKMTYFQSHSKLPSNTIRWSVRAVVQKAYYKMSPSLVLVIGGTGGQGMPIVQGKRIDYSDFHKIPSIY